MTAQDVLRSLELRPITGKHSSGVKAAARVGDSAFSPEQLENSFNAEYAKIERYFEENAAALEGRRRQLRQRPSDIRIISDSGIDQLFQPDIGLRRRGTTVPVFRYAPPKVNKGLRKFKEGIRYVVMHGFGSDWDVHRMRSLSVNTPAIDPQTGHNPRRFANGISQLVGRNAQTAIHHLISLRGDLVNSVSWDNRCVHGEGGGVTPINDFAVGIEHEMWSIKQPNKKVPRFIIDQGPFSQAQYAVNAFILKKLEAYTGNSFTNYLGGTKNILRGQLKQGVTGCFSHASSAKTGKGDPGAEFLLPPEFELRVSSLAALPETRDNVNRWNKRFDLWYADTPNGTKISAYARIFEIVGRLRSFNLQSEVFNPNLGGGPIDMLSPTVGGTYMAGAAQNSLRDRLSGVDRAQQMQRTTRANLFESQRNVNAASATAWATHASNARQITQQAMRLPVVFNAVGFDFATGTWVNNTTTNQPSSTKMKELLVAGKDETPTTDNTDPTNG